MRLIFVALLASMAPAQQHETAPTQKLVYCGPMFDHGIHLDAETAECVERALNRRDIAVVMVPCPDGKLHPDLFWVDDNGVGWSQTPDEVCD